MLFNLICSPEWISERLVPAVLQGRDVRSRDPGFTLGTVVYCVVDDDVARATELVRPALGFYFTLPYFAETLRFHGLERELAEGTAAAARGDTAGMTAAVSDEMVSTFALVGRPMRSGAA